MDSAIYIRLLEINSQNRELCPVKTKLRNKLKPEDFQFLAERNDRLTEYDNNNQHLLLSGRLRLRIIKLITKIHVTTVRWQDDFQHGSTTQQASTH